jgi:hypothetical protein
MIMPIMTVPAPLMHTEKVFHEVPDTRGQVRPRPSSVGHPP